MMRPKVTFSCARCALITTKRQRRTRPPTFCSRGCAIRARFSPFDERFRAMIDADGPPHPFDGRLGACHLWKGYLDPNGYGSYNRYSRGKSLPDRAHRIAWQHVHGPIPPGGWILHSCDRRACVNVAHLRLGSPSDNTRDRLLRKGSQSLTATQVREIRARKAAGEQQALIANAYGVGASAVSAIVLGKTWRSIT